MYNFLTFAKNKHRGDKMSKKNNGYISIKESRAIIKHNVKMMKYYESLKRRKLSESEYTSVMDDENNV